MQLKKEGENFDFGQGPSRPAEHAPHLGPGAVPSAVAAVERHLTPTLMSGPVEVSGPAVADAGAGKKKASAIASFGAWGAPDSDDRPPAPDQAVAIAAGDWSGLAWSTDRAAHGSRGQSRENARDGIGSRGASRADTKEERRGDARKSRDGPRGTSRDGARPSSRGFLVAFAQGEAGGPPARSGPETQATTRWSSGGMEGKTTVATILTPRDGMLGMITEVPVQRVDRGALGSRSSNRPRTGGEGRPLTGEDRPRTGASRPYSREGGSGSERGSQLAEFRRRQPSKVGPEVFSTDCDDNQAVRRPGTSGSMGRVGSAGSRQNPPPRIGTSGSGGSRPGTAPTRLQILFQAIRIDFRTKRENLPDLPELNILGLTLQSKIRSRAVRLALDSRLESFWMFLAVLHFLVLMPEFQYAVLECGMTQADASGRTVRTCKHALPTWHHFFFLSLFLVEAAIKIIGLGLTGGKYAWWTNDFFNKLDVLSLLAYVFETINAVALAGTSSFSLRAFRLIRILQVIGHLYVFSDLETIFMTINRALKPMITVLLLIWFVLTLFGIMGMAVWGKSAFQRRCVWADTMEITKPEILCKRIEYWHDYGSSESSCTKFSAVDAYFSVGHRGDLNYTDHSPKPSSCPENPSSAANREGARVSIEDGDVATGRRVSFAKAIDNTCGAMQLCLDISNPNMGFGSFDHLPAALLTLFQFMSGDSDVSILWWAIQAEPYSGLLTRIYFLVFAFLMIHVFINVFVAVFANIFAECRADHQEELDRKMELTKRRRIVVTAWEKYESLKISFQIPIGPDQVDTDRMQAQYPEVFKAWQAAMAAEQNFQRWERKGQDEDASRAPSSSWSSTAALETEQDGKVDTKEEELDVLQRQIQFQKDQAEKERILAAKQNFVGSLKWFTDNFKTEFDPSLKYFMSYFCRDNNLYDTLCFSVTLLQSISLALMGNLCEDRDCETDQELEKIVQNANFFFLFDIFAQIVCDGSVANHFAQGENIFNFIVTFFTTMSLIFPYLGMSMETVAALRGMAILRLLRVFKFSEALQPIWKMLVKACGSLVPVMNLVIFNTCISLVYFSIGRSLFGEALDMNFRYNYSSMSRGYMLLLTVLTGDSWSSYMYGAMSTFCTGTGSTDTCDNVYLVFAALFYTSWFFYGQFLFITMFLAIILEAFAIEEFMDAVETAEEDRDLNLEEARARVAAFQDLPLWAVSPGLLKLAFLKCGKGEKVGRDQLLTFVRLVQPMTGWRIAKALGMIRTRAWLRNTCCECFAGGLLAPCPGDDDYIRTDIVEEAVALTMEEAEVIVAGQHKRDIEAHVKKLVASGMLGECLVVASALDVLGHIDQLNPHRTDPIVAIKILRHVDVSKRLGIEGYYDHFIEHEITESAKTKTGAPQPEFKGLNLSVLDEGKNYGEDEEKDSLFQRYNRRVDQFNERCLILVQTSAFNAIMLGTIILSSVFLCLETPHPKIEGQLPRSVMMLADLCFNIAFTIEAITKIAAWGLYTPRSVDRMSYLQTFQNQADLFVLLMAIFEMVGLGDYLPGGPSTSKVIRLMKVLRPVRLLMRSEGLKNIMAALFASLKPMSYATLFLFVVCIVFSVTGMAFFRYKFHSCNDLSLDGLKGEGRIECVGPRLSSELYMPRVWEAPPWGNHFDTLPSSVAVLFRCLTLNWSAFYVYAQDAYLRDVQPVPGVGMVTASLYFHLFLLVGSFFGLNLFASFMCDTFYSLQGTAQLEEVQWMAVKAMLKENRPKKIRKVPSNVISTFLRELLTSSTFQSFSAGTLLLNVSFMGMTHSTQDSSFGLFLDLQNEIFFSLMCVEAALNIIAVGPTVYILVKGNQFDIFIILATAVTMIFQEAFRSLSQSIRILRLVRFLKILAKDKTIANVFETITVSIGQVMNIMIILLVLLIMLSVLAVQLFGLTRPGMRLGTEANFSTFDQALQTIVQLMFGEDFPTLWNDCSIQEPKCTPDIYDTNGDVIVPSDCPSNSYHATWFFPMVLVLTNYVMLNLFVGMIMNNFAFISTKDGNGVIENEHFVEAAYKYVLKLDPKIKGQIPLEKVYQFYNLIGEPLGNFGTTKNTGRYLCIREELKQKIKDDEFLEFTWWFETVYTPICNHLGIENDAHWAEYREKQNLLEKTEKELRDAVEDNAEHLAEVNLKPLNSEEVGDEAEEDPEECQEDDDAAVRTDHKSTARHGSAAAMAASSTQSLIIDNEKGDVVVGGNMGTWAGALDGSAVRRQATITDKKGEWVSASNMGMGGGPRGPSSRVKVIKKKGNVKEAAIYNISAWEVQELLEEKEERRKAALQSKGAEEIAQLKIKYLAARQEAEGAEPTPTIKIRFLKAAKWIAGLFLPDHERSLRAPGHVHYNEIILAMLYWNKNRNIVPVAHMEKRKKRDDMIKYEVAFQIMRGLCQGAIERRRRRLAREQARERLRGAKKAVLRGVKMKTISDDKDRQRRKQLRDVQDDYAKHGISILADDPTTGPLQKLSVSIALCRIKLLFLSMSI